MSGGRNNVYISGVLAKIFEAAGEMALAKPCHLQTQQ